ncbi:MAG: L,D-transpeptidase/peptidoglycan binding protein [Solirubrobacterales bacterium]|nr:L,D-transpeptidase/peptidoglycan binding protein [Solirubrobacterales bacterium]
MRTKSFIAVAASLAAFLVLAGAVVAYDRGQDDKIAEGVRVAGVDVGGLTAGEARAKLRRSIVAGLQRPIVVDHGNRQWRLTAAEAKVTTNLDATVDDALERSRDAGLIKRTWRNLTGGELHASLEPEVTYSDRAVVRMLDRIRKRIDRDPVDAKVDIGGSGISQVASRTGLAVDASSLHRQIRAALVDPEGARRFAAATKKVRPKVSTEDLAEKYPAVLILHRNQFKLTLYKNLKPAKTYDVAVGAVGLETPAGLYHIQNKAVDPAWTKPHSSWVPEDERGDIVPGGTPENPLKARWMGIFDGAGIHGIDPSEYGSIGHAASHGCVRMRIPDVKELYDQVPVGAPIFIS